VPVKDNVIGPRAAGITAQWDWLREEQRQAGRMQTMENGVRAAEDDGMRSQSDVWKLHVHQQLSHVLSTNPTINSSINRSNKQLINQSKNHSTEKGFKSSSN